MSSFPNITLGGGNLLLLNLSMNVKKLKYTNCYSKVCKEFYSEDITWKRDISQILLIRQKPIIKEKDKYLYNYIYIYVCVYICVCEVWSTRTKHWLNSDDKWPETKFITSNPNLKIMLFQKNIEGQENIEFPKFYVPIGTSKNKKDLEYRCQYPMVKYHQDNMNSCFFISLYST